MSNKNRTTLYIGVTNDLRRRINEHMSHKDPRSFTARYNINICIYFEEFSCFSLAIRREKELKKWSRYKKENLINKVNPGWKDLLEVQGLNQKPRPFYEQVQIALKEILNEPSIGI